MAAARASRSERRWRRAASPVEVRPYEVGPYPARLLVRRLVLGAMISAGLLAIIGAELRHALTDEPHELSLLAFGVSLVLFPVVTAAISSIAAMRRAPDRARPAP